MKSVKTLKVLVKEHPVGFGGPLKSCATFQNAAEVHFIRLLVRMILGALAGMISAQSLVATDFTSTVTATPGFPITLHPGDTVTTTSGTDSTNFDSYLSGTVGRFGGGLAARLSQSVYIYGEYDYAKGDHIEQPWSVSAGLRWQW